MKITVSNEQTNLKPLEYYENFWTGKRKVNYDGVELTKVKANLFEYKPSDKTETFQVSGNGLIGVNIKMFGRTVEVLRKLTWYEIVLSVVIFVSSILFCAIVGGIAGSKGFSTSNCAFCGAVCGGLGGMISVINLYTIRQLDKWYIKVIISILFLAITLLFGFIFAKFAFKILV